MPLVVTVNHVTIDPIVKVPVIVLLYPVALNTLTCIVSPLLIIPVVHTLVQLMTRYPVAVDGLRVKVIGIAIFKTPAV